MRNYALMFLRRWYQSWVGHFTIHGETDWIAICAISVLLIAAAIAAGVFVSGLLGGEYTVEARMERQVRTYQSLVEVCQELELISLDECRAIAADKTWGNGLRSGPDFPDGGTR